METTQYDFKMVQLPKTFTLKQDTGKEIAAYLEKVAEDMSAQGWEFYRVDTVGVSVQPGCFATLFGARETMTNYNVVTFRKLSNPKPPLQVSATSA